MYFLNYYTLGILILPGILLSIYAEIKVHTTYNKYREISSMNGRTAYEVARMFLDMAGLTEIKIIPVRGYIAFDFFGHIKTPYFL